MRPTRRDRAAISRYWNALVAGRSDDRGELDPKLARPIAALHARDDAPPPEALFAEHLEEQLMRRFALDRVSPTGQRSPTPTPTPAAAAAVSERVGVRRPWQKAPAAGWIATVTLMLVVLGMVALVANWRDASPGSGSETPVEAPEDEPSIGLWPHGVSGAGFITIMDTIDPLTVRLARLILPPGAAVNLQRGAMKTIVVERGVISVSDSMESATWRTIPVGASSGLPEDTPSVIANRGDEPAEAHLLVIGQGPGIGTATGGATIELAVEASFAGLRPGIARYRFEGWVLPRGMPMIVDAARDGAALLIVESGSFVASRDGGVWAFGRVQDREANPATPVAMLNQNGSVTLVSGDYALVDRGAALHGSSAGEGEARFLLITIEVNSAVVQELESRSPSESASPPAGT